MDHVPVLIEQILPFLKDVPAGIVVDATFGAGGYTRQILEKFPSLSVVGVDQDKTVLPFVAEIEKDFGDRFSFIQANFESMKDHLEDQKISAVVMDLGVSSMQIDQEERGFSYQQDGPLDMRMNSDQELSAYEIVNTWERKDLRRLFWKYGEEKHAPLIAANICHAREKKKIESTKELRDIIERAAHSVKAVMRVFQAIRIEVNDELGALERGMESAAALLQDGGLLIVVTFHSLEDRLVKNFMIDKGKAVAGSRYAPVLTEEKQFNILTRKPLLPTDLEIETNQRSRSAKLRVLQKKS
ncbi:MAG: 16S rRNA (cytosine(1402)-N(4))-methyltransferase RsmH [Alphaproteobacteria bacterium]|nr:16S rRNA (cytosine(1402)-N(4))-methyltransferase RsmH [Alphaproteobacteria bacterium]MBN2779496.1 16S rRNA (cytosine(1402)-N(4))-methyltransferase RsmH [Alphaproteobacteria bacterium]